MASLMVLVVPSLAVSYIKNMAYRKARRLHRDVPPARRGEGRSRMERRASFRAYRGSVILTTCVVMLGVMSLLFLKPDFSDSVPKSGLDPALSINDLLMGGYFE